MAPGIVTAALGTCYLWLLSTREDSSPGLLCYGCCHLFEGSRQEQCFVLEVHGVEKAAEECEGVRRVC